MTPRNRINASQETTNTLAQSNRQAECAAGVARFDAWKDGNVDLPNRRWKAARIALRFVPLFPSKETRLVLPHVERVGQDGLVLDPDDLLMDENPTVAHGLLDLNLALRGVPDIDSCVVFTDSQPASERLHRMGLAVRSSSCLRIGPSSPCSFRPRSSSRGGSSRHRRPGMEDQWRRALRSWQPSGR